MQDYCNQIKQLSTIKYLILVTAETNVKGDVNQVGHYFIAGDHTVNGSQTVNGDSVSYGNQMTYGTMTVSIDVIAGGISQVGHTHGGVKSGGSSTSTPN